MCKERDFLTTYIMRGTVYTQDGLGKINPDAKKPDESELTKYPVPKITKPDNITKSQDNW